MTNTHTLNAGFVALGAIAALACIVFSGAAMACIFAPAMVAPVGGVHGAVLCLLAAVCAAGAVVATVAEIQ